MNNSSKNHYEVLGVLPDASDEEIKQAFHDFAKNNHPDRNPQNSDSEQLFKQAALAYETLKDPLRRQAFDEAIAFDKRKKRTGRRQGRRLLMLFALLLLAPSAIFLSLFISGDKSFLSNLGFLPNAISSFQTGSGETNATAGGNDETSGTTANNGSAVLNEPENDAADDKGTGSLPGSTGDELAGGAAPRTSLPENIGPVAKQTANQSVPASPDKFASHNQGKPPVEQSEQSPIPEAKVAELKPTPPEIVLSTDVNVSGPFSDCNICPLMFIPRRSIVGIDGTNHAISMSEITIAQWENCTNDGACPKYDRGTARKTDPVTGMDKEAASSFAAWLSRITGQTYAIIMPEEASGCSGRSNRFTSNRWEWVQAPSNQGCETSGGFRVSRQTEPGS